MDADDVEGVVVVQPELPAHGVRADDTGREADDERAEQRDRTAGRGDRDQARDRAGGGAQGGRVAVALLLDEEPAEQAGAAGGEGVEEGGGGEPVGAEGGAGVEAEPAEPEQTGAEHDHGQVVRAHGVLLEARDAGRGPGASARPEAPEVISTGRPPAKSRAPSVSRIQPPGPHTQWATGTYTSSAHTGTKTSHAPNFARSAIAPLISAAVMIAKVSWKVANRRVGTVP